MTAGLLAPPFQTAVPADAHSGVAAPVRRVLFVSSGNGRKGVDVLIQAQADSLAAQGVEIEQFLVVGLGFTGYLGAVRRLRRQLRIGGFDLIHAHYGYCGIVADLARRREPLVVSFMGTDLLGPMNHDGTYGKIGRMLVRLNRLFAAWRADYCIAKSANLKRTLARRARVAVIPNGVDFRLFFPVARDDARRQLGLDHRKKYVLFVGDPERAEKNFPLALAAVRALRTPDVELIALHGRAQTTVNLYYSAVDALILTSYYEGSPNAVKEAMACNCPIVSVRVGDVESTIGTTKNCYVTDHDQRTLTAALGKVLATGDRTNGRLQMSSLQCHLVAERILAVYTQVFVAPSDHAHAASANAGRQAL